MDLKNIDIKKQLDLLKKQAAPVMRHFYFIFIMFLVAGVGICTYFVTQAFAADVEAYRIEKQAEFHRGFQLSRDDKVIDHVLQLETAKAGPIVENYDPGRDNPFVE